MSSQDKDDLALQAYLQGKSGVSESYRRASNESPPVHLDNAILAASRKAVKSKPRLAFSPFASDWHVPVALAAVLVLSVTLVILMQDRSGDGYLQQPSSTEPAFAPADTNRILQEPESEQEKDKVELGREQPKPVVDNLPTMEQKIPREPVHQDRFNGEQQEEGLEEDFADTLETTDMALPATAVEPETKFQELERKLSGEQQAPVGVFGEARRREDGDLVRLEPVELEGEAVLSSPDSSITTPESGVTGGFLSQQGVRDDFRADPASWRYKIQQLWQAGDEEQAREELKALLVAYPDYDREALKSVLPPALWEAAGVSR